MRPSFSVTQALALAAASARAEAEAEASSRSKDTEKRVMSKMHGERVCTQMLGMFFWQGSH